MHDNLGYVMKCHDDKDFIGNRCTPTLKFEMNATKNILGCATQIDRIRTTKNQIFRHV